MIIVSDTSPISNLIKINRLSLLQKLYGDIVIPLVVYNEILALQSFNVRLDEFKTASWIRVQSPSDTTLVSSLLITLDKGESEAIALAKELQPELLLIDERAGAETARSLGIKAIGLLGVLIQAKQSGQIENVRMILDDLRSNAGFWIAPLLYERVLITCNEDIK